jgi:hypothetical protein
LDVNMACDDPYRLAGHGVHDTAVPATSEYVPMGHMRHTVAPASLYFPAEHSAVHVSVVRPDVAL